MGKFTPSSPSTRAINIIDPRCRIPIPDSCHICDCICSVTTNKVIYGRDYGAYPWIVLCQGCGARVGFHPNTNIPLGSLADEPTREARKTAKTYFLAQIGPGKSFSGKSAAYHWLAGALELESYQCHFGWFNEDQCEEVVNVLDRLTGVI